MSTILDVKLSSFCIYRTPFIPHFGEESAFSLITVCLEFCILLFLLSCILRKKWYQCHGEENKARSLLLPFYDRVLYYYCIITLLRIMFYLMQFIYEEVATPHENTQDPQYGLPWWIIFGNTIGVIGIIALEVFILFLLMQTSAGTKALKRAYKATAIVCSIELIIILLKHLYGDTKRNYILFCVGELLEELLLFCIFIGVFIYSYFYQIVKNRKRERNKILYVYILLLCMLLSIIIVAYILLIFKIDAYCLDIIDQYLFRLLFPWIAFITIRSDSEFWRLLLLSWQTSSTRPKGEDGDGKQGESDNIWDKIKTIFGTGGVGEGKKSFLNPLIDALSMGVRMVDFTELQETSDPIAMGSTATVSKAKLYGETVAIKVFIFDELSLEVVSEFFRESLLISDLHHENIVEFKGACLRPPELCLVYEYCCCGDLTHLLLTQYFHSNFLHNNEDLLNDKDRQDPKLFQNRLKMLIDVSRGMTRLHDAGIIHRDLKTSNILVHYKLGKYVAKVCDFGSARKILGNNVNRGGAAKSNAQFSYTPPKRLEHAKSHDFVSNEDLPHKQVVKSIQHKVSQKKLGIAVKKHEVVVENKPHHKMSKSNQEMDLNRLALNKSDSTHGRRVTVNISQGIFGWKAKRKSNIKTARERNTIISHSLETNDEKIEQEPAQSVKSNHKPSVNYDDMEEEEKYDQPQPYNTPGDGDGDGVPHLTMKGDFDDIDTKTEATDYLTELASSHNERDPTKLAFSVSPLLLTTQVGTLAFMAPEILSHVNIGALSGGWLNKKEENENENDKSEYKSEPESKSEENLETPPELKQDNMANDPSGNHLEIADLPRYRDSTTTTATTDTAISNSLQSETIVIKIDTKTDPNYQPQKKSANYLTARTSPSPPSSFSNEKSAKAKTAPIAIPQSNKNKKRSVISRGSQIKKLNSLEMREVKKRFSREYINKHRQFARNELSINIASVPRKALPPSPKKRTISGVSNSFKKLKMFSSSLNNNSWQNRDIFVYNNPLPPNPNNYKLPNSMKSEKQLQVPSANKQLPALPKENDDARFSTVGSAGFGKLIRPKNMHSYIHRELPPDPPKRRKKEKANYFSRGRTQSKFGVRNKSKSKKTSEELEDDARSVIYDTHKFEIIYEASNQALYNDSVDVYSFGVIMWEAALCDRIYNQMDMRQIRDMVCQGRRMHTPSYSKCKKLKNGLAQISNSVYNAFMELVNDCWAQSPIDRLKFYEIENRLELIQNLHQMKMEQVQNEKKMRKQYHE